MTLHTFSIVKSPKDERDDSEADFDLLFGAQTEPNDTYHRAHCGILFDGQRAASHVVACLNACRGLVFDDLVALGHGGVERKLRALESDRNHEKWLRDQAEAVLAATRDQREAIRNDFARTLVGLAYLMNQAKLSDLGETNNALVKAGAIFDEMMDRYGFGEA